MKNFKDFFCRIGIKILNLSISFIIVTCLIFCIGEKGFAQNNWIKYDNNPVITPSSPVRFDDHLVGGPSVLYEGNIYKMWYHGQSSPLGRGLRIGYAISEDGIQWQKINGDKTAECVLDNGETWDKDTSHPHVLYDQEENIYKMWYWGHDWGMVSDIGYAFSDDGVVWEKYSDNPVLEHGVIPDFSRELMSPSVMKDNTAPDSERYKMWFAGSASGSGAIKIGYTTSSDGITWNTPIVVFEPNADYDEVSFNDPCVVKTDDNYHMFYDYYNTDSKYLLGYATSENGINWFRSSSNPVLELGGIDDWDNKGLASPFVIFDGLTWEMWYYGTDGTSKSIGYATSGISLTDFSVFATNSIWLKPYSEIISGNVGVNDTGTKPFLYPGKELCAGTRAKTSAGYSLIANRIRVQNCAVVESNVYYNELKNNGTINGSLNSPLDLPLFETLPEFHSGVPGTDNIIVGWNKEVVLDPDDYKNIVIKPKGKLILTGGIYNIQSLDARNYSQLLFRSSSEVRIAGKMDTDFKVYIGPEESTDLNASDIVFFVDGINGMRGKLWSLPKAVQIGVKNTVCANFYVPNGTLWLGSCSTVNGSLIGKNVIIGMNATVELASYLGISTLGKPIVDHDSDLIKEEFKTSIPNWFSVAQNYPNPFNSETIIIYTIPEQSHVSLDIYNVVGEKIITLTNTQMSAGYHSVNWNGKNSRDQIVTSGIYLCKIQAGGHQKTIQMLLLK